MRKTIWFFISCMNILVHYVNAEEIIMPEHFANQTKLPSCIVHGVNVISGDYTEFEEDLVIPGIGNHHHSRSYVSSDRSVGNICHAWNSNFMGRGNIQKQGPTYFENYTIFTLNYTGPNGAYKHFTKGFHQKNVTPVMHFKLHEEGFKKGLTNVGSGKISGATNPKNDVAVYHKKEKKLTIRNGEGEAYEFAYKPKEKCFKLRELHKLNGHKLEYEFDESYRPLKVVLNNSQVEKISLINMHHIPKKAVQISGDGGAYVKYKLESYEWPKGNFYYTLKSVESNRAPAITYEYNLDRDLWSARLKLKCKKMEGSNFLSISYYRPQYYVAADIKARHKMPKGEKYVLTKEEEKFVKKQGVKGTEPHTDKVSYLCAPRGHDGKPVAFATFDYKHIKKGEGITRVHENNNTRIYFYKDYRLDQIIKRSTSKGNFTFAGEDYRNVYTYEAFEWYGDAKNKGNLKCRQLRDPFNRFIEGNQYFYDERGNVVEEHYRGNLTGTASFLEPNEKYIKKYTYHSGAGNLIASECDGKKKVFYHYHPNNNLLKMKYTFADGRIQSRTYYDYDKNSAPYIEINDDGSSEDINDLTNVTERHITYVVNRTEFPVGLPQTVYKKYLDLKTGQEHVLFTKMFSYSPEGWVNKEEVFDEANQLISQNSFVHNERGKVIQETNIFGHTTFKEYNSADLLISVQTPRQDYYTTFSYDFSYRLIAEEQIHANKRLKKTYRYDSYNNKTSETDVFGNKTFYKYDDLNRLIEVTMPSGQVSSTEYNFKDQATSQIDHYGNRTLLEYTSRNQPCCVTYPDGKQEKWIYDLDGTLLRSIAKDGTITENSVDYQGRVIKQVVKSSDGDVLYETRSEYNAFHLLKEIDAAGTDTTYEYDSVGRLVRVKKLDCMKDTAYDSAGRISEIKTYSLSDSEGVINRYEYDLLNRVVYQAVCDLDKNVQTEEFFYHDIDGNITEIHSSGHAGQSISKKEYDSLGNVISSTDAEGNKTIWTFNYAYMNAMNECVAYEEMTDPMGKIIITIKNVSGQVAQIISRDPFGNEIHKTDFFYNHLGQLIEQRDYVYDKEKMDRTIVKQWVYNSLGEIVCIKDAVGSNLQKERYYTYNSSGQKSCVKKSDGVYIDYKYDLRGLLKELSSSDGTVHYCYEYDILDNLIKSADLLTSKISEYQYNLYNEIIYEKLSNKLEMRYTYDGIGRETMITLPDQSSISKKYKGNFLKSVSRNGKEGDFKYEQAYEDYDKTGLYKAVLLPGNNGKIEFEYDVLGRVRNSETKHWKEVIRGFDASGNMISKENFDDSKTIQENFTYDALNQLTSEKDHRYTYDSLHNRTSKDGKQYYLNDLNQVMEDGQNTYRYDPCGNLIEISAQGEITTLSYDALDRLKSVEKEGSRYLYEYDARNRRIAKESQLKNQEGNWTTSSLERYLYQGQCEIGAVNEKDEIIQLRILGIGKGAEIGASIALEIENECYVPIHDHQGNIVTLLHLEDGHVVEKYSYSSFGEETMYNGEGEEIEKSIQPWHFSSKRLDLETDFVYFGYRYYSKNLGRWVTADPLGDRDGPNLYAYVKNSPLSMFDSFGLMGEYDDEIYYHHETWKGAAAKVGEMVEGVGFHVMPPCEFRQKVEGIGLHMQGQSFDHHPSWDRGCEAFQVGNGPIAPGVRWQAYTGINSEVGDTRFFANCVSDHLGGKDVLGVCHLGKGLLTDLGNAGFGVFEKEIDFMYNKIINAYNAARLESNNPCIYLELHSRATLEFNVMSPRLPEYVRKCVDVCGYGGEIIQGKGFASVQNIMNRADPLLALNKMRGHDLKQITFTDEPYDPYKGKGASLSSHYISNPYYQEAINKRIKEVRKERKF